MFGLILVAGRWGLNLVHTSPFLRIDFRQFYLFQTPQPRHIGNCWWIACQPRYKGGMVGVYEDQEAWAGIINGVFFTFGGSGLPIHTKLPHNSYQYQKWANLAHKLKLGVAFRTIALRRSFDYESPLPIFNLWARVPSAGKVEKIKYKKKERDRWIISKISSVSILSSHTLNLSWIWKVRQVRWLLPKHLLAFERV